MESSQMTRDPRIEALVAGLALEPHPEGGYYREWFRSPLVVQPTDGRLPRAALTAILYLLPEGVRGAWHRVQSDEVWHLYEGGPLELCQVAPETNAVSRVQLGTALVSHGPVHVVPAGYWQRACSLGAYTLAGCTVGPGFEFDDFEMLASDSPEAIDLDRRTR